MTVKQVNELMATNPKRITLDASEIFEFVDELLAMPSVVALDGPTSKPSEIRPYGEFGTGWVLTYRGVPIHRRN